MNSKKKKNLLIVLGGFWILYSISLSVFGKCDLWINEDEDGWYLMRTVEEEGEPNYSNEYDEILDGPMSHEMAIKKLQECIDLSDERMKRFGTVYNMVPSGERLNVEFLRYLIRSIIFLGPLYFFTRLYRNK